MRYSPSIFLQKQLFLLNTLFDEWKNARVDKVGKNRTM